MSKPRITYIDRIKPGSIPAQITGMVTRLTSSLRADLGRKRVFEVYIWTETLRSMLNDEADRTVVSERDGVSVCLIGDDELAPGIVRIEGHYTDYDILDTLPDNH